MSKKTGSALGLAEEAIGFLPSVLWGAAAVGSIYLIYKVLIEEEEKPPPVMVPPPPAGYGQAIIRLEVKYFGLEPVYWIYQDTPIDRICFNDVRVDMPITDYGDGWYPINLIPGVYKVYINLPMIVAGTQMVNIIEGRQTPVKFRVNADLNPDIWFSCE